MNENPLDRLANPFRKRGAAEEAPRPSQREKTPKEFVKLYVMALVFFMAIGTMIYMWKFLTTPKAKPPSQGVAIRPDGTRGSAPEEAPLPPVKKDVPLQDLPQDGVIDFKKLAEPFIDGLEKPLKETPEFVAMLRVMLTKVKPGELEKRAHPEYTADKAYLESAKARGEVVKTYGRLIKIYTEPLDTTIPEKVEHVYLGIMMEYPTNRTVWFYLPEKPVDASGQPVSFRTYTKRGEEFYEDWVEITGVALRRYDYPSQYETEKEETAWARALILFSRGVTITSKPRMTNTRAGFIVSVVVISVIAVAIILTAGVMTRKYGGRDSLRMIVASAKRQKAKEQAAAVGAPKDGAPPPTPPPSP